MSQVPPPPIESPVTYTRSASMLNWLLREAISAGNCACRAVSYQLPLVGHCGAARKHCCLAWFSFHRKASNAALSGDLGPVVRATLARAVQEEHQGIVHARGVIARNKQTIRERAVSIRIGARLHLVHARLSLPNQRPRFPVAGPGSSNLRVVAIQGALEHEAVVAEIEKDRG